MAKETITLDLSKTELEKLMLYAMIGSTVESIDQKPSQSSKKLFHLLMSKAEENKLNSLVQRENGVLVIAEKAFVKMEKEMAKYEEAISTTILNSMQQALMKKKKK